MGDRPATQTDDGPSRLRASVGQPLDFIGSLAQRSRQLAGKHRAQQRATAAAAGAALDV
jgi:hypothetical protein